MGEKIETAIIDAFSAVILSKCKDLHRAYTFDGQQNLGGNNRGLAASLTHFALQCSILLSKQQ